MRLVEDALHDDGDPNAEFLGGPPEMFESAGREQLIVLLEHGLNHSSSVLDIGCGCLRGGRWIIPLLEPGHYCGIEPQRRMIDKGLAHFIDPDTVALKKPRFDYNADFDFSVFGRRFTHFMARSIWTHAAKPHIEKMLDGMLAWGEGGAVMLASFHPAGPSGGKDYQGIKWVGRSHESARRGIVSHSFDWLQQTCKRRDLRLSLLDRQPLRKGGQVWAAIGKA